METKKPAVDIRTANEPALQLRRYGWSGNLSVSILTNFSDLIIYDCSVRPLENDPARKAVVAHYHYTEYVEKFEEIYSLISKDAVVSGDFSKAFSNTPLPLMKEPFDDYFLNQIRRWRNILSQDILDNNDNLTAKELNILVQRILNRIVFLRICEDRSFEQYETLRGITTYDQLRALFAASDRKYDSGLFNLIDEETLNISDTVIVNIFQDLYYPNSSYEFSVVDPYIIGQIYEVFLVETISITQEGTIECIGKPEAVDSLGAINTPKNIADYVVEETLKLLYEGNTPAKVFEYRIADICCGLGNFLMSAYEYIINYHIEYFRQHALDESLRLGLLHATADGQTLFLSFELKRNILISNIFGVDIDVLAVEVTKLSLLLKLLENVSVAELDNYMATSRQQALPDLDTNIKNGNSLIDQRYADYNPNVLTDMDLLAKINMFNWDAEFEHVRFDAIVGNPPYIRIQKMVHYSLEEYRYYRDVDASGYATSAEGLLDKYYLFIERGLSLLSEHGYLGFIIPHRFMNTKTGGILREWLSNRKAVRRITHFGTYQVLSERSTYTCVAIFSAAKQEQFEISFVRDWGRFLFDHTTKHDTYPVTALSKAPWTFIPGSIRAVLDAASPHCAHLDSLAEIFVGVQTSADRIYIIKPDREDGTYVYFTDKDGRPQSAEKAILRNSIYDCQIKKYESICYNSYIIFPYRNADGNAVLYSVEEMTTQFPHAYRYLTLYRDELVKRNLMVDRTEENWFAYGRNQSLRRFFGGEHLVWPVLSTGSNYVFDDNAVTFTGGGNGPYYGLQKKMSTQESIFYIQAILNYWLMEYLVSRSASTFRGDYYSHGKQFIATLPIYRINFDNPDEVRAHTDIVEGVRNIMNLVERKNEVRTQRQRQMFERAIVAATDRIESILDSLYGVSKEERMDI